MHGENNLRFGNKKFFLPHGVACRIFMPQQRMEAEGGRGRDRAHVDVYMAHRVTFEDFL